MQRLIPRVSPIPADSASPPGYWRTAVNFGAAFLGCLGFASLAPAASVQLAWDRNSESNIAGYELSYGTTPGNYPNQVDAGNNTTATVSNLKDGTTYYFVVVARNKAGRLSPKSAEISYLTPAPIPLPPKGIIDSPASTTMTIEAGERVNFSARGSDPDDNAPLTYQWDFGRDSGIPSSSARIPGNRKFNEPGTYRVTLTVTDSLGISDPTPAVTTIVVRQPASVLLSQKKWKLNYVDSQEVTGYAATNAFDGNPSTFWHTQFSQTTLKKEPHEIQIDMGKATLVNGFEYLSRQDGFNIGNIGKYKFYVSLDGKKWGAPVASGTFDSSASQKLVFFTPKTGRYVRLLSITEVNGYTDSNVAELHVFAPVKTKAAAKSTRSVHTISPASAAGASSTSGISTVLPAGNTAENFSPLLPAPSLTTEVIDGKKYLALTLSKPLLPDGVQRTVEVSPDLLVWCSGGNHTTVVIDNEAILKVRDNTPVTRHGKRFIRLKETPR